LAGGSVLVAIVVEAARRQLLTQMAWRLPMPIRLLSSGLLYSFIGCAALRGG